MRTQPATEVGVSSGSAKPVVLVTGPSGFIGGAIIRRLSDRYTLVGLTGRARSNRRPQPSPSLVYDATTTSPRLKLGFSTVTSLRAA